MKALKMRDNLFGSCHHNLKKISHVAYEFVSIFNLSPTSRRCSTFDQWLSWCTFVTHHAGRTELNWHLCMLMSSFEKLLSYIRTSLKVDSDMKVVKSFQRFHFIAHFAILLEVPTLIYSFLLVYQVHHSTMFYGRQISWPNTKEKAVDSAAGFSSTSTNHVMTECVAVLNSYHMAITTSPKKEVHNIKSYFSGHYQTYGINIQAACDHNCHFLFIGVDGPGIMGDREAVKESGLSKLVEKLPSLLYCIGDCAYTPTEDLIPIYGADNTMKS